MVSVYTAYTSLAKTRAKGGSNETIQLAGCWAHLRRKFYDLHITGVSQAATDTVVAMSALWKVEDDVDREDNMHPADRCFRKTSH
jgi:transposase